MSVYKDDVVLLSHIADDLDKLFRNLEGKTYKDIFSNEVTAYFVYQCLQRMGEASSKTSPQIKLKYPEFPWKKLKEFRNKLIHNYYDVDTEIVWMTIQEKLAVLPPLVKKMIEKEGKLSKAKAQSSKKGLKP